MKRAAKHFTHIQMVGEMIARPENRIKLSNDKDEFGLPPGHSRPKDGVASARLCPGASTSCCL